MNTQMEKRPERAEVVQQRPAVAPRVDIFENKDELLVIADMPGVAKDGLTINLDAEQLSIEGRISDAPQARALAREWRPVDFRRSFVLPQGIDREKITAELKLGVLTLHLPKAASVKPRQITVKAS
jgi:HSP20 family molecular chaperone IbpA